jgi:uncharacterized protein (TIGR02444 family)
VSLWDWAVQVYARPGAAAAALALQDQHGLNICYLLWAAWSCCDDPERLAGAAATARDWDRTVVAPLRQARRTLQSPSGAVLDRERETLRAAIAEVELQAERLLLAELERGSEGPGSASQAEPALSAAARAWGGPVPEAALAALAGAILL